MSKVRVLLSPAEPGARPEPSTPTARPSYSRTIEKPSRRQFLAGAAAFVGAALVDDGWAGTGPASAQGTSGAPSSPEFFGQLFPTLPPFAKPTTIVKAALLEVGAKGGIMDAKDDLTAGPKKLISEAGTNGNPTSSNPYGNNPDNPTNTAGTGFFGQFIDHDITFDQTSSLGVPQVPQDSLNSRTPALDLDSVFGAGPTGSPQLYVPGSGGTHGPALLIGTGGAFEDLPRTSTDQALVADLRNDQTVVLGALHCAHILFYNQVLAHLSTMDLSFLPASMRAGIDTPHGQYVAARQVTLLHYQWLVVHQHLPQICGAAMVDDVLTNGNRYYLPPQGDAFTPIEFSAAAYRYGHSIIRPSYRANFTSGTGPSSSPTADPFYALLFDPSAPNFNQPYDRHDLMGGFPARRRYVGWQSFFDAGDGLLEKDKRIDTSISSVLFDLPTPAIPPGTQHTPVVLPQRTLLRQLTWELPSGQSVAKAMGVTPLTAADLSDIGAVYAPFATSTPLWYYLLAESKVAADGLTLGPTGGRIVAETLIGLLRADPNAYLGGYPRFTPFLGTDFKMGPKPDHQITGGHTYTTSNFLHYAGVLDAGVYR